MSEITLEVGKTYDVRDPEYVINEGNSPFETIIDYNEGEFFCFVGEHYGTYTAFGKEYDLEDSPYDLVREVTEATTSKQE